MKKILLLVAGLFLLPSISFAETTTVWLSWYGEEEEDDFGGEYYSDVTFNPDGTYTLWNLVNSGVPVTFSFDKNAQWDEYECAPLTFKGSNLSYDGAYAYVKYTNNKYANGYYVDSDNNTKYDIKSMYIYTEMTYKDDYFSYVYREEDEDTGEYYYYVCLYVSGYAANGKDYADELYVEFYLPEETGSNMNSAVFDNTVMEYKFTPMEPVFSDVTVVKDNEITISNFYNSGSSITLTFGDLEKADPNNPDNNAMVRKLKSVTPGSDINQGVIYYFPEDKDGNKLSFTLKKADGSEVKFESPWIEEDEPASYDEETGVYEYNIFLSSGANWGTNYVMTVVWNELPNKDSSAVEVLGVEEADGEVEYYNLQGIRVVNPKNGVYVRRQGNKATKVFVK